MDTRINHSNTIIAITNWTYYVRLQIQRMLTDKSGTAKIPDSVIREIAMCLLPAVVDFFATEEGIAEFEAWKQSREAEESAKTVKASKAD